MSAIEDEFRTPGQLVGHLLNQKGWTNRVLAVVLGVTETVVSKVVNDTRPIDAKFAIGLEEAFGVDAARFLTLQSAFDLARARLETAPDRRRSIRADIYGGLPVPELIKRGWIDVENPRDSTEVEAALCRFFRVNRLEDTPVIPHAAKKTDAVIPATPAQLAWLHRVRVIAEGMLVAPYSPATVQAAIDKIHPLRGHPEHMSRVPRILAEAGIRFVVVEGLPKGKIDGVCFWLDGRSPVIGMTLRYDRIDNFIFVLRHELEHVKRRDGLERPIIDVDLTGVASELLAEEELAANAAASEFCVPSKMMAAFVKRKAPYFSEQDLLAFAKMMKVHPGIIAGQLQHATGQYNRFRDHLVKVRAYVSPSAEVDGWGDIHPVLG